MEGFTKLEDIATGLTLDLHKKGFNKIDPQKKEILRYKKRGCPNDFQAGIEQAEEEEGFNSIYLKIGYNLPKDESEDIGKTTFPNHNLLEVFFRNTGVYNHSLCGNTDRFNKGRMNMIYHIEFEKDKTTTKQMNDVLRNIIDYICDYATTNIRMIVLTGLAD